MIYIVKKKRKINLKEYMKIFKFNFIPFYILFRLEIFIVLDVFDNAFKK